MTDEVHVDIAVDADIVLARQEGRRLAMLAGFRGSSLTLIATAISELARNIIEYARTGAVDLVVVSEGDRRGLRIFAVDQGPGIADVQLAMQDGYTTGHGLGIGLPGARRLMDEFEIASEVGKGTTVQATKWVR